MPPRATYRLQFHEHFTFDDAAALAPYLAALGVSHLYASPLLKAHAGSTHGYDIVDFAAFNPEIGGEAGFERLSKALAANDLRLVLDFVPNHMGVGGSDNLSWLDMLEWGEEADHAGWFDVDWTPDRTDIRGKVLVPLLGSQYGEALRNGDLRLKFDAEQGTFAIWAHEAHKLPVNPLHYETVLAPAHPHLEALGDAFADLLRWRPQVMRRAAQVKADLSGLVAARPEIRAAIDAEVERINGQTGDLASWRRLDELIARQNWKAAHFLVASDDINYRRFFNIATLAGLRMELPEVFDETHRLVFDLMRRGALDGLRIDHIDGLFDPKAYLERLRSEAPARQDGMQGYLVVEKILGPDEPLREDWPVDGTTGYEFTNLLTGLFVHAPNEADFSRLYTSFTGETRSFARIVYDSKLQIIDNEMSSELHRLARAATRVARQNPLTADFTLTVLQRALRQIVAAFPVYRTYVDGEGPLGDEDRASLATAIEGARTGDPAIDPSVFTFLSALLSGDLVAEPRSGYRRADVFRCAMKVQQYCGPVMAKGVEDTAFYRYNRFVALNEVGGSPERFGVSVPLFHAANRVRAERWPGTMLATSTHDTKRGEDTRARLAALSTVPQEWHKQVHAWSEIMRLACGATAPPDRNDEFLLYQLLVGTWPVALLGAGSLPQDERESFVERLKNAMTKSIREAKVHSTWTAPDDAYEKGVMSFIDEALLGATSPRLMEAVHPFMNRVAELGASNTFAQTVLKFTVPGMPDIYQGSDLWDLTMVDPDNRRPIDFASRTDASAAIAPRLAEPDGLLQDLWATWRDGRFKLALTMLLLRLRVKHPALFAEGSYEAIPLRGARADRLCAFLRRQGGTTLLVVARIHPGDPHLGDVAFDLPSDLQQGQDVLGGRAIAMTLDLRPAALLDGLPAFVGLFEAAT